MRPRPGCQTSHPSGCPHPYSPGMVPTPPAEGFIRPCPSSGRQPSPRCLLRLRLLRLHPSGQLLASPPLPLHSFPRRRGMICDPFPSITMFSSCHSLSPLKPVFPAASSARLASSLHICSLLGASSGPSAEPAVRTQSSHPRVYVFQGVNSPVSTQLLSQQKHLSLSSPLKASPQPSSIPHT